MEDSSKNYLNVYGTWNVTTEGDCEGKSTSHLGTYTGFLDEIALHLADKCYYSLQFDAAERVVDFKPTKKSVHISFGISSKTWDMGGETRVAYFRRIFKDRPNIEVKDGQFYASVEISNRTVVSEIEKKERALAKLSDEEKKLLGL